jgi:hypothetical protein
MTGLDDLKRTLQIVVVDIASGRFQPFIKSAAGVDCGWKRPFLGRHFDQS